jgi:galactokinase
VIESFYKQFGKTDIPVRKFQAPARINIIGEHVDYLGGLVLPAAINFSMQILIRPNLTNEFRFYSENFKSYFSTLELRKVQKNTWVNYILGVIDQIQKKGHTVPGFDLSISGNIPLGAGLSSSAAVEVVVGYALSEVFQLGLNRTEIALLGQAAENDFVGTKCGIMDQFVIAWGKKNNCISLDTSSLKFEYHEFDLKDNEFYLIQSNVKHSLNDSEYNNRRKECESAFSKIKKESPNIQNLFQVNDEFDLKSTGLTEIEIKRVIHVISEKSRIKSTIDGLNHHDFKKVGKALTECHWSLSKNYEVSCKETDFIVETLEKESILGARMIGGGFGGCVLVLDKQGRSEEIFSKLASLYEKQFKITPELYHFTITDGVHEGITE